MPADELYELLARPDGEARPRAAILVGLRITGRLNFESADLRAPLIAHGCHFDAPVNLIAAKASEISLTACHLPSFVGDRLETRGALDLSESTLAVIGLLGARIGGQLNLFNTALRGGSYPPDLGDGMLRPPESPTTTYEGAALVADGLQVGQGMFCRDGFTAEGEIRLPGAHIGGRLSFSGATLKQNLTADGLQVDQDMFCRNGFTAEGEVRLPGAHIGGQLTFNGATLKQDLTADGLQVDQEMFCADGFTVEGEVLLRGAHIGSQLSFNGATLRQALKADDLQVDRGTFCRDGFTAEGEIRLLDAHLHLLTFEGATLRQGLNADGLRIDQSMFCRDGFTAGGELRLPGAHIGGQLTFDGATLRHGIIANGLQVDLDMFCRGDFTAEGEVRLLGAHIGGQLAFNRGTLGRGLDANGLRVDQDMFCTEGFTAGGELRLRGAQIGGRLVLDGASLSNTDRALNLEEARVDGEVSMLFAARPGGVDLTGARLGRLHDSESTWPARLRLRGCVYGGLEAAEDALQPSGTGGAEGDARRTRLRRRLRAGGRPDARRRLRWIRLAEEGTRAAPAEGAGYAPSPYTQLMTFYRREGRDVDARRVAYERERRRRGELGLPGKIWNAFLQWTVGYGYKPLRALVMLTALVLVGSLVFSDFHDDGHLVAVKTEHQPFVASIYTLDRLIPVVSLGLRDAFAPSGAAQWWAFAYTLLGWMLTVAVVACQRRGAPRIAHERPRKAGSRPDRTASRMGRAGIEPATLGLRVGA